MTESQCPALGQFERSGVEVSFAQRRWRKASPNTRMQRTRSRSPLMRYPLGGSKLLLGLVLVGTVVAGAACAVYGTVAVSVRDENGNPVPGALVSIAGVSTVSDSQGIARVKRVPTGESWIYVPDVRGLKSCPAHVDVPQGAEAKAAVLVRAPVPGTQLVHSDDLANFKLWEVSTRSYTSCPGLPSSGITEFDWTSKVEHQ